MSDKPGNKVTFGDKLLGWLRRTRVALGSSSHKRLERELKRARRDVEFLSSRNQGPVPDWRDCAVRALDDAEACLEAAAPDIEGGWTALHSARRYAVFGMLPEELEDQRIALLEESKKESGKLTAWRSASIEKILVAPTTATKVADAMALRDDSFANQYNNIWMRGDQVWFLWRICLACSALYLLTVLWLGPIVFREFQSCSSLWSYRKVATALFLGLLGAALSALWGMMADAKGMRYRNESLIASPRWLACCAV